jgi:hypothetical protein
MQILANTDEHVDAVPDLVERVRNEILKSLSRFSQRVTRVDVHLSDQNADRRGNEFKISQATGREGDPGGVGRPAGRDPPGRR